MYLGFDTSNYTTSLAMFDGKNIFQQKRLLTVRHGERGLRQSEASLLSMIMVSPT